MGRPFGLLEKLREPRERFCCAPAGGAFLQNAGGGAAQPFRRCRAGAGRLPPSTLAVGRDGPAAFTSPAAAGKKTASAPADGLFATGKGRSLWGKPGENWGNRKNRRINVYIISGKDNTNPPFQMGGNRVQWRQNTPAGCRKEKRGHHHESIDA